MVESASPDYYDVEEQKGLGINQLDKKTLIWLQVKKITDLISVDPDGKGCESILIIGGGAGAITEKKYIDHPHHSFYYAVRMLATLLKTECTESAYYKEKYSFIMTKFAGALEYDVDRTFAWLNLLMLIIDDNYGKEKTVNDII